MSTAIRIDGLSKRYAISHEHTARYETLRDAATHHARAAFQRLRHPLAPNRESTEIEDFWALRDVDLEIHEGDRVGIIGANGAGKSTLLKILSRITAPTSGHALIHGRVTSLLEVGTGFHPELTGRENIYLNAAILGMTRREIGSKFDAIVAFAEVEKFLDTPVKRYSSGMYVRLAFSVAAHLEPEILIVDEVLAVGDAGFQKKCLGKMGEAHAEGRTVLFVSHNMQAVKQLCNRGVVLDGGRVTFDGTAGDAVSAYLERSDASMSSAHIADAIELLPDDPIFRLESLSLSQDGQSSERIDSARPLDIDIHYEVFERTSGLRVYFDLCDGEETVLLRSFHDEDGDQASTTEPGRYHSRVSIPGGLLGPTSYLLIFRCAIYNGQSCIPPEGLPIRIDVEHTGRYNRAYLGDTFRAKFALALDWKTERLL
ncbi:MAG: ATP-binding cassette domain-containing protein [bacterium]|nr:ATP-binding cassette domain-containing protein [bacterium]